MFLYFVVATIFGPKIKDYQKNLVVNPQKAMLQ